MKTLYAFLLATFLTFVGHAQIVNIPDPAFKTELLSLSPAIDTNGDGEIQTEEALAVTYLSMGMCNLDNVIGIQSFTNLESLGFSAYCTVQTPVDVSGMTALKNLSFHKSSMPTIDVAGLTNLETISVGYGNIHFLHLNETTNLRSMSFYRASFDGLLDLTHAPNFTSLYAEHGAISAVNLTGLVNIESITITHSSPLTSLDITDQINLKNLRIMACGISEIDLSNNNLLEDLNVTSNNLTALNVTNLTLLTKLWCGANMLTTLDVSNNVDLLDLYLSDNLLPTVDLSNLHKLKSASFSGNLFTTIDLSTQTEVIPGDEPLLVDIWNNPNLISVNLKNGRTENVNLQNCPNLIYICLDEIDMEVMGYIVQQQENPNIQINTYCDFVPGGTFNTITGVINHFPEGCNNGTAYPVPHTKVSLTDGTNIGITFTDINGRYNFYTQSGDFTITPELENTLFSINPENAVVSFADNLSNSETRDFCVAAVGVIENLELAMLPIIGARPGFDAQYQLILRNTGNQMMSGTVAMTYNDAILDLVQTSPSTTSQTSGNLSWNYSQLLPFESRTITVTLNVNSPMEIPAVSIGDVLHFDATITSATSETNYHATLDQVVVGSFDPNDKICLEGATITPEKIGAYLHYVIRFENSGTAAAENIVVKDVLDAEKFDVDSFQLVGSSHPHTTRILGNKVEFIFEGIQLPAAIDDEAGSHGYVAFKVKTKNTIVLGDSVSNIADIYFDYNFPITTEPATTTVSLLARNNFEDTSVSVYPNPVKNNLQISARENITSIQLFDLQGRIIRTAIGTGLEMTFDMSGNANGVYFVKIATEKGTKIEKIIKE